MLVIFLMVVFCLTGRRNARRVGTKKDAQRAERIRDRTDTVVILSILDDH